MKRSAGPSLFDVIDPPPPAAHVGKVVADRGGPGPLRWCTADEMAAELELLDGKESKDYLLRTVGHGLPLLAKWELAAIVRIIIEPMEARKS